MSAAMVTTSDGTRRKRLPEIAATKVAIPIQYRLSTLFVLGTLVIAAPAAYLSGQSHRENPTRPTYQDLLSPISQPRQIGRYRAEGWPHPISTETGSNEDERDRPSPPELAITAEPQSEPLSDPSTIPSDTGSEPSPQSTGPGNVDTNLGIESNQGVASSSAPPDLANQAPSKAPITKPAHDRKPHPSAAFCRHYAGLAATDSSVAGREAAALAEANGCLVPMVAADFADRACAAMTARFAEDIAVFDRQTIAQAATAAGCPNFPDHR